MAVYYFLGLTPFIFYSVYRQNPKERNRYTLGFFFVVLCILLALRHVSVGTDLEAYSPTFESISKAKWKDIFTVCYMEKGYVVLNKIVSFLGGDFRVFLCVVSLMTTIPFYFLYKKETNNPILCIALYLGCLPFSMFFSGLRQAIAMAFIVPSYLFVKNKKIILFICTVLLASLFHKSALVVLLLYPIYHIRLSKVAVFILAVVLLLTFVFRRQIFLGVTRLLGGSYADSYGVIEETDSVNMLLLFVAFYIYSYVIPYGNDGSKDLSGLRNVLLLMVAIQIFASINTVVMRMNFYFMMLIPCVISKTIENKAEKNKTLTNLSIVVMTLFFFVWFFYNGYRGEDVLQMFPYRFFWE